MEINEMTEQMLNRMIVGSWVTQAIYVAAEIGIADFLAAIREDRPPVISGHEALKVHCLIDALIESSRERKLVAVAKA